MKNGMVCSLRINTKDCLAILDLMHIVGIDPYDGRSFASCTSMALSSLIDVARKSRIIKMEEDGFQYLNKMKPFIDKGMNKKKNKMAEALYSRAAQGIRAPSLTKVTSIDTPTIASGWTEPSKAATMPLDEDTKGMLFEELNALNEMKNKKEELTTVQEERYDLLMQQLGYA